MSADALADALGEDAPARKASQATRLIELARTAGAAFLHDGDRAYARVPVGDHHEIIDLASRAARLWLQRLYYTESKASPTAQAVIDALGVLSATARYDGEQHDVALRVARRAGAIYIDLADPEWRAVEVTAAGWRVVTAAPIYFRRTAAMRPLPLPVAGGAIGELRDYLNIGDASDFNLVVSWMVAALHQAGPYAVLAFLGEQGAAKSVGARVVRSLIDPNVADLRSEPREERDLMVAANSGHVLALDNLSGLRPWLSDALCRVSTGAGFAARQLYTDADESIIVACRPVLLTSITDILRRDDLADRAIVITLPFIRDADRRDEQSFWAEFEAARGRIFGALLDLLVASLANADVALHARPRMADFARRAAAVAPALGWTAEDAINAINANRGQSAAAVLEGDAVAASIMNLIDAAGEWVGPASQLRELITPDRVSADWPRTPHALSARLDRLAPAFRRQGITVERLPRRGRVRPWRLSRSQSIEETQTNVTNVTNVTSDSDRGDVSSDVSGPTSPNVTSNVTGLAPESEPTGDVSDVGDVPARFSYPDGSKEVLL